MIDKQALDAHLTVWARQKNLAGVSAYIAGPNGCEYAWNYGFRDATGKLCPDSDTMYGINIRPCRGVVRVLVLRLREICWLR